MSDIRSGVVLVCTVGGSHAPILSAIRRHRPDFVWFVCTKGRAGSKAQVLGKGKCIKKDPREDRPTLPNIPTQAGLSEDRFDVCIVPADDPDAIHAELRRLFDDLVSRSPRPRIVADYTGGTKSMTAALLMAGLEYDDVELSMVVGQRNDLVQVADGTETAMPAAVDRIRFSHKFRIALSPWKHFGYAEAAIALETMSAPRDAEDRASYLEALAASRGFAAWDRFDHVRAYTTLSTLGNQFGRYLPWLSALERESDQREPARLFDLYLNVLRRAARAQYDDAVARAYRLLEWTAQWLLRRDAGIDTSDVPADRVPAGLELIRREDGRLVAGLRKAWRLLETVGGSDDVRAFARDQSDKLLSLLSSRNGSILAHGFEPVSDGQWRAWQCWLDEQLLPLLRREARASGMRRFPEQLPTSMPKRSSGSSKI